MIHTAIFSRQDIQVGLRSCRHVAEAVAAHLAPYFRAVAEPTVRNRPWTVIAVNRAESKTESETEDYLFHVEGEPECHYALNRKERTLQIVAPDTQDWFIHHAVRLIRTLAKLEAARGGMMFIHAAMVEFQGQGIVFAGKKRAGKTSTCLSFMAHTGGGYVSNDDLSLVRSEAGWRGFGWPRAVGIRRDTLRVIQQSSAIEAIPEELFQHPINQTADQLLSRDREPHGLVFLYPRDVVDWFKSELVVSSPVKMLVFPEFCENERKVNELTRIAPSEAHVRLRDCLLASPSKNDEFLVPSFDLPPIGNNVAELRELVNTTPAYILQQHHSRLHSGTESLLALFETIDTRIQ